MSTEELEESELGTQEYWDGRYKMEVSNYRRHGDVGEIWFGEDSIDRVSRWIYKSNIVEKTSKIIDVGCGNGILLIELANNGYEHLTGIDYSQDAIVLAKEIADKHKCNITYQVVDILNTPITTRYDVVNDKGTYDAISLSANSKKSRETYLSKIFDILNENGVFIITSCNWTVSELDQHFSEKFDRLHIIPTPQFMFAGKTGSSFTSAVYKKKAI